MTKKIIKGMLSGKRRKEKAVDKLKTFESACYCDLIHMTCSYCKARMEDNDPRSHCN